MAVAKRRRGGAAILSFPRPTRTAPPSHRMLIHRWPNGLQLVAVHAPQLATASVSVFVRVGSAHERPADNGISHVVEHMVFKGSATRDAARINLDAERLGAEVNAHTDKDHTAYHLRGRPEDAARFVHLLADLLRAPTFPADELERERQVLLQEMAEVDDDPMALAYQLFDRGCYGAHPAGQPVIGTRRNLQRFTRDELQRWVARHHVGAGLVVAAMGPLDPQALAREVEAALAGLAPGEASATALPAWQGDVRTRRFPGSSQAHVVLGYPLPPLGQDDARAEMAALLFGEGMSSPLMAELRERRGLAYYAACAADRFVHGGQFMVEVSCASEQAVQALGETRRLLAQQAQAIDAIDLERARHQMTVRLLRRQESAMRALEPLALELMAGLTPVTPAERLAQAHAVDAESLRTLFEAMLHAPPALAITGQVPRGARERATALLEAA